jgi:crossover junction endonuclease MUS81
MYLVEEYDTHNQKEAFGVQISTALSSTQVVDGFMVKETKNLKDTVNYLTGLTQELIKMHEVLLVYFCRILRIMLIRQPS